MGRLLSRSSVLAWGVGLQWPGVAAICAAVGAATISLPCSREPHLEARAIAATEPSRAASQAMSERARRKDPAPDDAASASDAGPRLLATLVQLHTDERVPLDRDAPSPDRFRSLLADRVTGSSHEMDPRLLGLLRALAERHPGARFELVSGFRSPKLNEALRKKGHNVASHSQHSLGHAVDFRIVHADQTKGIDPREMEKEIRKLGWDGGVGVYPSSGDWFVHADVGRNRHWGG